MSSLLPTTSARQASKNMSRIVTSGERAGEGSNLSHLGGGGGGADVLQHVEDGHDVAPYLCVTSI